MPAPERLTIITHRHAGTMGDQALLDVAGLCGVNSELFDLDGFRFQDVLDCLSSQRNVCVSIAAPTLVHLSADRRRAFKAFIERSRNAMLLIHSITPDVSRHADWLGEFLGMQAKLNWAPRDRLTECHFSKRLPSWTGPLTGCQIGRVDPENDALLQVGRGKSAPLPLLTPGPSKVGGEMIMGQCRLGAGTVCMISSNPPDDDYASEGMAPWLTPSRLTRLLPFIIFVRGAFGDACWSNPRPRATLVWNDARVTMRPNEIDLRDVAAAVSEMDLHVALAMPAAEFGRFDSAAARLLRDHLSHFSVAPYGNLGEGRELDIDLERLEDRTRPVPQAVRRMVEYGRRAKSVWSRTMVAPGGICHASQIDDLRLHGVSMLLAQTGVRSPASPWKRHEGLEPASLDRGGFPVVPVRYDDIPEQAIIDAYMGRPMVMAFRSEWFISDGEAPVLTVLEKLAAMEEKPVWTDLETLSRSLYLVRRGGSTVEVRMFSNEAIVEDVNLLDQPVEVIPPMAPTGPLKRVVLDGLKEGKWLPTSVGDLQFEILDETTLRLTMRCETPDIEETPLGSDGVGVVGMLSSLARRLPVRLPQRKRR